VVKDLHSESNSHDKATYHRVVIIKMHQSKREVVFLQLVSRLTASGQVVKKSEDTAMNDSTEHSADQSSKTSLWRLESPNDVAYRWADWSVLTNRRVEVEQYMYCI